MSRRKVHAVISRAAGATSGKLREKEFTLAVVRKLAERSTRKRPRAERSLLIYLLTSGE